MTRFFNFAAAALVCGFVYLLAAGIAVPEAATDRTMFVVSAVALLGSILAIAFAVTAGLRMRSLRTDLNRLARSVDAALSTIASERDTAPRPDTATPTLPEPAVPAMPGTGHEQTGNVVPHPATMRNRIGIPAPEVPVPLPSPVIATALRRAIASGAMKIVLNPIVPTARDGEQGFDVLVRLHGEAGAATDLWRIDQAVAGQTSAAAERLVVAAAVDVALRPDREPPPLHIGISGSLLGDRDEIAALVDLLKCNAGAARCIVLCLPVSVMRDPGGRSAALARLAAAGVRFAAEGWPRSLSDLDGLWQAGVSFVRLPAERLLAGTGRTANEPDARTVLRALSGSPMAVVATAVGGAQDAAALASLGVAMMVMSPAIDTIASDAAQQRQSAPLDG
ncbi:MAG: EAL domain-containing protein [Mesorhizobium sp.]|nr:EAL domain-containing protein [Mesorhizobium sp.]MBN9241471.1 EAL domain-containing protein [Mesorhizobium sp.]